MKFTAFLLSFYFLLIVSQPALGAVARMTNVCTKECGRVKPHPECPKKERSCPKENSCPLTCCNAFQNTFCCGALVEEADFGINLHPRSAIVFHCADQILHSSYSSDCWQPPELA